MVSRESVIHVARLAKLKLTEEETERLAEQLGQVLEYVEQLDAVDDAAEEMTHVAVVNTPRRADEPRAGLDRRDVMALAPKTDGECMQVPPVIDGGGGA